MHTALLIGVGLVCIGLLSAILEILALRNHPYVARVLAVVVVALAWYARTWSLLLVVIAFGFLCAITKREFLRRAQSRRSSKAPPDQYPLRFNYYDRWRKTAVECPDCRWRGTLE